MLRMSKQIALTGGRFFGFRFGRSSGSCGGLTIGKR
jgi:hypothetical protein